MLRRIEIKGYKSLVDVRVDLQPLVVLFGPNGAGKSNFLDALQLLSRMAVSPTLKSAFEPPYRGKPLESFSFDDKGIPGLLRRESARFSIQADVELSPAIIKVVDQQIREMKRPAEDRSGAGPPTIGSSSIRETYLRYRVEVEVLPGSGILRVADEYAAALSAKGKPNGKRKPFLERVGSRIHLRMEGQAHPTYHDRYLDHTLLSRPLYPPHYPHLVALRQELESWLFYYFEPRERMRALNPVKEVRHIGVMGEELAAFLNTLWARDQRQFRAVEKALHMMIPSISGIEVEVNSLGEVELRLREGNTLIPARVVSEGTLRILGLMALAGAKEVPGLVGFEEPENGIHPRRLQLVADLLRTRAELGETQMIVTTHSPFLVDLIPREYLFTCKKHEGRTQIERLELLAMFRRHQISEALEDGQEPLSVSARILRGDLDA
jgi:predicted ATPase